MKEELAGRWVLVTGASSGLGRVMCVRLARDYRVNIVATARRMDRLEALVAELRDAHGVEAAAVAADLTQPEAVTDLVQRTTSGRTLHGAILNAGVTYYGPHAAMSDDALSAIIDTNVTAIARLTTLLLRDLDAAADNATDPQGRLMLVSSLGGSIPIPYQAAYSATKAFVTMYGRALQAERSDHGSTVTVYAPGGIATELLQKSGLDRKFSAEHPGIMSVDRAATAGIDAFVRRARFAVPGLANKASLWGSRILPGAILSWFLRRTYKPPTPDEG